MSNCQKIFYDEKGQRWLKTKIIIYSIFFAFCLSVFLYWPSFVSSSSPAALKCCEDRAAIKLPAQLAYSGDISDPPVIGEGHLERVMEVKNGMLVEPFTGEKRPITPEENKLISNKKFVIERYGATKGRYVSVTFDDGPDPKYTPRILDVLAREKVQATFFITGENATKYPELVRRIQREGHLIGNHTFTHIDFDNYSSLRDRQEVVATDKVIRNLTGHQATYFRLPYNGGTNDEKSMKENIRGILQAQQLGFEVASFNFDSNDWDFAADGKIAIEPLSSNGNIVLMHDAGGDRTNTITYLEGLIKKGKRENYKFVTMAQLSDNPAEVFAPTKSTLVDKVTFLVANILFVLPDYLMYVLFLIAALNIFLFTLMNMVLALLNKIKIRKHRSKNISAFRPFVSVAIAAYNEELVIENTIKSIVNSSYKKLEIIVVDDGSTDKTNDILRRLTKKYKRLRVITQENSGKSAALNNAIKGAKGEIIVMSYTDTVFLKDTIRKFVRNFFDKNVGAVAGFVKVGNMHNLLTCWQAMEYVAGISLERFAHSFFGTIMITPGACGAWRKQAVIKAGGYSSETLAEDCDLTLQIQKAGYKTLTDLEAIGLTEAPTKIHDLLKQRFRWMFGNLQVFWKHKDMIFNYKYGFLGMFIIPQAVFAVLIQLLFLPFTYLMIVDHFIAGEAELVLIYFLILMILQFFISFFAIWISKEKYANLIIVPTYRLIAEPLRAFLLYASFISILKGRMIGWNKVRRLGEVKLELIPLQKQKFKLVNALKNLL